MNLVFEVKQWYKKRRAKSIGRRERERRDELDVFKFKNFNSRLSIFRTTVVGCNIYIFSFIRFSYVQNDQ